MPEEDQKAALEHVAAVVRERSRERYRLRDRLRGLTSDMAQQTCGAHSIRPLGSVDVRRTAEGIVGVSGLASCGRVWTCPFCAPKIYARRRFEVEGAVANASAMGLVVVMVTLTLRHRMGDPLADLLHGLSVGWAAVGHDKRVRQLRREVGWVGYIRGLEVLYGANGWHPHLHMIGFLDPKKAAALEVTDDTVAELGERTREVWTRTAKRVGLRAPNRHGYDLRILARPSAEVADYLTKSTWLDVSDETKETAAQVRKATFEVASPHTKGISDQGLLAYWQWLPLALDAHEGLAAIEALAALGEDVDDAVRDRLAGEVAVFREYEAAMKGQNAVRFSQGLRARLFVGTEQSDEKVAAESVGSVDDTVLGLLRDGVRSVQARRLWPDLRHALQVGGHDDLVAFCERHGLQWCEPDDPTLIADRKHHLWEGEQGYRDARDERDELERQRLVARLTAGAAPRDAHAPEMGPGTDERTQP